MNAQQITQIAQHLNISPNQVKEVQEWAYVYFVKFTKGSPRFVSKKVVKQMEVSIYREYHWAIGEYKVTENGKVFFVQLESFYPSYVTESRPQGLKVNRPDLIQKCEAFQKEAFQKMDHDHKDEKRIPTSKKQDRAMDADEALDCWFGQGNW